MNFTGINQKLRCAKNDPGQSITRCDESEARRSKYYESEDKRDENSSESCNQFYVYYKKKEIFIFFLEELRSIARTKNSLLRGKD